MGVQRTVAGRMLAPSKRTQMRDHDCTAVGGKHAESDRAAGYEERNLRSD